MKNYTGEILGYYIVGEYLGKSSDHYRRYSCTDIFGNVVIFKDRRFTSKNFGFVLYGASVKKKNKLHATYFNMLNRCYNSKYGEYRNYGGRGIKVCKEWLGDEGLHNFIKWAASFWESGLCLDRIDNDKGYSPENCRYTTRIVNNRNRRTTLITEDIVKYIRKCFSASDLSPREFCKVIAGEIKIRPTHVRSIIYHQCWKEV